MFTRRQALADGLTSFRIRGLIESGVWVPVIGDTLVAAGTLLHRRDLLGGAALTTGGIVSHHSAAELWDLPVPKDGAIHVSVPVPHHAPVPGVRAHRRPIGPGDRVNMGTVRVTSRTRTLMDCLGALPMPSALRLLDHSMRSGWLSLELFRRRIEASKGTHGIRQLRELLDEAGSGSWSEAERLLHRLLEKAGISGWAANARIELGDGSSVYIDVWFPEHRLAIEVDGQAWHVSGEQFQRDRARQNRLVLLGCTVLRFTWAQISGDPAGVLESIRTALSRQTYGGVAQ